jgi:ATP-dependent Lhr-like helicase
MQSPALALFHPAVAGWFTANYPGPTPPQAQGWPLIAAGQNVLLLAPTGSGKTLAAFLKCLDWLYREAAAGREVAGVQVLYISPLKALNNDIARNLEAPLRGIAAYAEQLGLELPEIKTAVRTGDTPANERQRMLRRPPQILITTPESLFLMLSSQACQILTTVRFVIVDEIHTLYPTKRGAHLALSLERLEHLVGKHRHLQRIGLSATMRPLAAVAAYLGGYRWDQAAAVYVPRPVALVDAGQRKALDLKILLPLPDLRELPERSIWQAIYQQVLELINGHRTTLVFVNNRRLAERLTGNLNQLAGKEVARTHHGSVSKERRLRAETLLKAGEIPCIVATASLELGIDIGHIDLVVQIETPKEVARGLQRVGRAGHVVGMPSKGRIIPKTRGDLLECAALLREMRAGRVEATKAICNSLDILAQQLVALTATGTWPVEEAWRLVRSAYNYQTLARRDFENVLKMLAGQFETAEFVELRPRLYWDRQAGELKPDAYGKRLIYSSGGTIPDRGYYGVYLQGNDGVRLGELDEEFVYERRLNERFVLGTSVWKIEAICQDRVVVSPARKSGEAIVPFWKAEQAGRPFELGQRIGAFLAELEERLANPEALQRWLQEECGLEAGPAVNIINYVGAQKASIGSLPTDRRLMVEEFPDEVGEWRVLIHSFFGTRVHLTLGLLIKEQWEREGRYQVEVVSGDNGIMFHLPGGVRPPRIDWDCLPLDSLLERVAALVAETPLFGITFRQAAQIALVMPRTGYGRKRTPFWLSRLKAGNLLHTVARYPDFPLVQETYRAIFQDHLELAALEQLLRAVRQGEITVCHCQHQIPSPFAGTHLFEFTGSFMYESETPKSGHRDRLFGLGAAALRAIGGETGRQPTLDPEIVAQVAQKARGIDLLLRTVTSETVRSWVERLGDVTWAEIAEWIPEATTRQRVQTELQSLVEQGKLLRLSGDIGPDFFVAGVGATAAVFDDRQPDVHTCDAVQNGNFYPDDQETARRIIGGYVRTRGVFQVGEIAARYRLAPETVQAELERLAAAGVVIAGAVQADGLTREWYEVNLFDEMRRRSLARARRGAVTVGPREYAVFLADWQGMPQRRDGLDGLATTLGQLDGVWLDAQRWEETVLPGRVSGFRSAALDQLIASGQVIWRARGNSRRLRVCFTAFAARRPSAFVDRPDPDGASETAPPAVEFSNAAAIIRDLLARCGALSLPQILQQTNLATPTAWQALEELIRHEAVTNDSFGPVRQLLQTEAADRIGARGVIKAAVMAQWGRWALLPPPTVTAADRAFQLLSRYGVVCREMAQAEGFAWQELYPVLDWWENLEMVRRGYFVSGFSGIQYALPEAAARLAADHGAVATETPRYRMIGWDDPANPIKLFERWLEEDTAFKPWGDYLVWAGGMLVLELSGNKRFRLKTRPELADSEFASAMAAFLKSFNPLRPDAKLTITEWNGLNINEAPFGGALETLGFESGYRELTLWPSRRTIFK